MYQNQSLDSCVVRCELYSSLTDFIRNHPNPVFMFLDCRMENSETNPPSRPLAVPDRAMLRPSAPLGQMSESPRASKHREHSSKSPRKRRDGKRSQRRGGDHEQLLWEIERRRLPGQHEHLEPCSSASDTAESSPKRFALQVATRTALLLGTWGDVLLTPLSFLLTEEPTFYMDRIQPLTSDPKPAFFLTQLQSCKHEGAEWAGLCVC